MAAHVTLPCGAAVTVTDTANGRSVKVIYKIQRKEKKKIPKRMVRIRICGAHVTLPCATSVTVTDTPNGNL
jgi:rare lipoprotein A (peptidoglycan hydrolase)